MSLFSTNAHHLLMEAARTELSVVEDVIEDDVESGFEDVYADIQPLDVELMYDEETVPVFRISDDNVVVEYDNLAKYMESNNVTDVVEALEALKEYYNVDGEMGIVVESYEEASEAVEEAKVISGRGRIKLGLAKIKASTELLKDLKQKNVGLFRKPSKKKPKKGKKK